MTIKLINLCSDEIKTVENAEKAYMIGNDIAVVCFTDGGERYYTNYKLENNKRVIKQLYIDTMRRQILALMNEYITLKKDRGIKK